MEDHLFVCKFGGTSVANAEQIKKIERILSSDGRRRIAIISAPGIDQTHPYKITDLLFNLYFKTHDVDDDGIQYEKIGLPVHDLMDYIEDTFFGICSELNLKGRIISEYMSELEELIKDEDSTLDEAASRGENFNARIIAEYLGWKFIDSAQLIHTCNAGDNQMTMDWIKEHLANTDRTIIPGFYGNFSMDRITPWIKIFSRGGSDLTGALIAAGTNASLYENWTDQDGIYCCGPSLFNPEERKNIPLLRFMSFREARTAASMGFKILDHETINPVMRRGIPIRVANTNNPDAQGTRISQEYDLGNVVRCVAGKNGGQNHAFVAVVGERVSQQDRAYQMRKALAEKYIQSDFFEEDQLESSTVLRVGTIYYKQAILVLYDSLINLREDILEER